MSSSDTVKSAGASLAWAAIVGIVFVLPFAALIGDLPSRVHAGEPRWSRAAQWASAILFYGILVPIIGLQLTSLAVGNAHLDFGGGLVAGFPLNLLLLLSIFVVSRRFAAAHGVSTTAKQFVGLLRVFTRRGVGAKLALFGGLGAMVVGLYAMPLRWGWLQTLILGGFYLVTGIGIYVCRKFATAVTVEIKSQKLVTDQWIASAAVALGVTIQQMELTGAIKEDADGRIIVSPVPTAALGRLSDEAGIDARLGAVEPGFMLLAATRSGVVFGPATEDVIRSRALAVESHGLVVNIEHSPDTPSRPRAEKWVLADGVGPSKAADLDAYARSRGRSLIEFQPWDGFAVTAALEEDVTRLRLDLANLVKADPWDLELGVGHDERHQIISVHILRYPPLLDGDKRAELYRNALTAKLPSLDSTWVVDDRPETGEMFFELRLDRLRSVLDYPWDAEVSYTAVPFGVEDSGAPLNLGLLETNQLLGGIPGGGKSGGLTALLAGISRLEHVALIGLDPKKVELAGWGPRFTRIAKTEDYATTLLEALVEEMERRYDWLVDHGLKKLTPAEFNAARPLLVIVIDELADLVSIGVDREEKDAELQRSTMIRRLIAKGRAAGIVVIAATQKPQSSVIPTELRDLIQQRVAYSTTTVEMSDTILGSGMGRNGGLAHEIPATQKGVCYVVSETSRTPVRARTYWVPDDQVAGLAADTAHLRIELPWLPQPPARHTSRPETISAGEWAPSLADLDPDPDPVPQLPAHLGGGAE